jgi:type II secretory pathway pseudopilin PulG
LVELLAVVGIIAMLSVAAVPVMRGLGGSQSSRATAQILVSALEQARTAAILSGTNAYLVILKLSNDTTYPRSYGIVRPAVDMDGDQKDDFQTNVNSASWVALSKWERLPGDLLFSTNIPAIVTGSLPLPGRSSILGGFSFLPSGGLENEDAAARGLYFASSNRVSNKVAAPADHIAISYYSGRVRYGGLTNQVNPF